MANQIPLSGLSDAAGGLVIPHEQADLLANGILQEAGALQVAGDVRATSSRRSDFPIWMGQPTASIVGEGGTKPATGAEFAGGTLNAVKIASIILFTDEMLEDVANGDLNVLVDSGVRSAIADVVDANAIGLDSGSAITGGFDTEFVGTTSTVELGTDEDALAQAVSAAMGTLEQNGYKDLAVLHSSDVNRHIRDARILGGGTATSTGQGLYTPNTDPFYGLPRASSTNLNTLTEAAGADKVVACVVSRPNVHVRVRKDIQVTASTEASVYDGTSTVSLFQNNLTALRYEMRVGVYVHDLDRAVVKITNES